MGPQVDLFPEFLDRPDSVWNQAAERSPQGDPFACRTEWQLSLQEAFFPRRRLHLRGDASSFVALAERSVRQLGPILEPIDCVWLFACPLLGPDAVDLLEALTEERGRANGPIPMILSGLVPGTQAHGRLLRRLARHYSIHLLKTVVVCSASLEGGLDGYLGRRSARLRKRLRQATRRAAGREVDFERIAPANPAEADAAFARMLAVEATSWKGLADCGMDSDPSSRFYGAMNRRLARSRRGRIVFARAGGRDVGYIFGGLAGSAYRGQQFSYAQDWAELSLGNLLQIEQIRWLAEDGIARYDMGPLMDYKHHWTETRSPLETLFLRP